MKYIALLFERFRVRQLTPMIAGCIIGNECKMKKKKKKKIGILLTGYKTR